MPLRYAVGMAHGVSSPGRKRDVGGDHRAPGARPRTRVVANDTAHDELMLAVLMQFRVAFRAISSHYHRVRKSLGVSGAQLWALAEIGGQRGITVGALARQLAVHQSTASNLVEALESAGLVERRRDSDDRRVVSLYPTARGTRVLRKAPQPLRGVLQQALCDLPAPTLASLNREMSRLLEQMHVDATRDRRPVLSDSIAD